jgi:hypothetical protein
VRSHRRCFSGGASRWHTDSSFREFPCFATVLYAITVPPEEGDTEFANMIAAYDSLSADEKTELESLETVHSYAYSRSTNPGRLEPVKAEELAKVPDVTHPLVRSLPDGRRSIYLGAHASHILDEPVDKGRARLRALEDRLTSVGNVYRHQWREGDLLIWDNRSTLHRLTGYAVDKHARVMRRCTVAGTEKVLPSRAWPATISAGDGFGNRGRRWRQTFTLSTAGRWQAEHHSPSFNCSRISSYEIRPIMCPANSAENFLLRRSALILSTSRDPAGPYPPPAARWRITSPDLISRVVFPGSNLSLSVPGLNSVIEAVPSLPSARPKGK